MAGFAKILFVRTPEVENAGAFNHAIRFAKKNGSRLEVAGIAEETSASLRPILSSLGQSAEGLEQRAIELEGAEVEKLVTTARERGVTAEGHVLEGPPFRAVIRKVLTDGHGLVVKAADRILGVREVLFGHLDRQLMRKCPCPIWIDRPRGVRAYGRVLAAVDTSPVFLGPDTGAGRNEFNASILDLAVLVASTEQSEVHVVHVWNLPAWVRATLMPDALTELEDKYRHWHEQALETAIRSHRGKLAQVHLLKGFASEAIPKLALEQSIDIVCMGTMARTGVTGLLIGNTAETVLEHVDCSVMTLKPPGFISPVSLN